MARINGIRFVLGLILLLATMGLAGCSSYEARIAYEEAELLSAEEQYDRAVEKYFEASELEPTSKKYKLELISSRTRAGANHVKSARFLTSQGKYQEALAEYRLANGFDPSIEVAAQEAKELRKLLQAQEFAEESATFYQARDIALAKKAVGKALKLDPNNARALAIKELLLKEANVVMMDGIELDIASEEPITLSFKDAEIKEVFSILSKLSGINFIFDEEIRTQSVSVTLEKASFAQAMELIMQMNGLDKKILNSRTIIIYPETREKDKQYEDQLIQTFYLSHIDAKKAVNLLRTMLQLRKVYVHEERNALVIRDTPDVVRLAQQIIDAADRENSEVIFDLELVSVGSGDELKFGPRLSTYSTSIGFSEDGENIVSDALGDTTEGLVKSMSDLQTFYTLPSASFDFAKTLADSEILASPKVRVRNKEKAKVHIGTREPVITVTQNGDNYSDSVQYVDVGVKLDVEPNIQLNGTVETKLKLEVSQKIAEGETDRGTRYLTISTTNAETVLTLRDGVQTIIGGLFEQQDTSSRKTIPFLGDIPLLGSLFTSYDNKDLKREILLSITPYIIKQVEVPDADVATIWSGGEDNLKDGPNFGSFAKPLKNDVDAPPPIAAPAVKKPVVQSQVDQEEVVELTVSPKVLANTKTQPVAIPFVNPKSQDRAEATVLDPVSPDSEDTQLEVETPAADPRSIESIFLPHATPAIVESEQAPTTTSSVELDADVETPLAQDPSLTPIERPDADSVKPPPVLEPQAESVIAPDKPESADAAAVPPQEELAVVMTEALPQQHEVGVPIALELPPKVPASVAPFAPQSVDIGAELSVKIEVKGIERLYSAPLFVTYDPALLQLVNVREGSFLKQEGETTVFSSSPNRATGQVIVGYKQGSGGLGVSGSGELFSLNFKAKATGSAKVETNRVNFRDPDGVRIQVISEKTIIEIR
ncbi:MAG: cohesin domain-containing protein [Desulfuromonadales bacterium]|nr:cohesin domain-containing protein [Desulfuromonadales bacterium]